MLEASGSFSLGNRYSPLFPRARRLIIWIPLLLPLIQTAAIQVDYRSPIAVEEEFPGNPDVPLEVLPSDIARVAKARTGFEQVEREMNATYRATIVTKPKYEDEPKMAPSNYAQKMTASQEAWLAYRNAHCRIQHKINFRHTAQIKVWNCLEAMTRARTKEIGDLNTRQTVGL